MLIEVFRNEILADSQLASLAKNCMLKWPLSLNLWFQKWESVIQKIFDVITISEFRNPYFNSEIRIISAFRPSCYARRLPGCQDFISTNLYCFNALKSYNIFCLVPHQYRGIQPRQQSAKTLLKVFMWKSSVCFSNKILRICSIDTNVLACHPRVKFLTVPHNEDLDKHK